MNDTVKWIIVGFSIATVIFNTGVTYNKVNHLKESVKEIWKEINKIKSILIEKNI